MVRLFVVTAAAAAATTTTRAGVGKSSANVKP